MECCWCKLVVVVVIILTVEVSSIPLNQFFPFGPSAGDQSLTLGNDDSSRAIVLSPPFTLFGRQRNFLFVNSNGVVSLQTGFQTSIPRSFPHTNVTILCPFWDDVDPSRGGNIYHSTIETNQNALFQASQLVQATLEHTFLPNAVFTATWDRVAHFRQSLTSLVTNTFQLALATNGEETFLFFLYADSLIQWTLRNAQVGVDGGDGVNYYSIPNSLTREVINITHTSNVNTPGLWILKVDSNIVAGVPNAPSNLSVLAVATTELTFGWAHNSSFEADIFNLTCMGVFPIIQSITNNDSRASDTVFTYTITGLRELTDYTCEISAANTFGSSSSSDNITVTTNSTIKTSSTDSAGLSVGEIAGIGIGGAAFVLFVVITILLIVCLCVVMARKRKMEVHFSRSMTTTRETRTYKRTPNTAMKSTTNPEHSRTVTTAAWNPIDHDHEPQGLGQSLQYDIPQRKNVYDVPRPTQTSSTDLQNQQKSKVKPQTPPKPIIGHSDDTARPKNQQSKKNTHMTPLKPRIHHKKECSDPVPPPQLKKDERASTKPISLPNRQKKTSTTSEYMPLDPASMGPEEQYMMPLTNLTKWGSIQDTEMPDYVNYNGAEEPQYVNSQDWC